MRLFVETNFVLEIVLEQEQAAACEALLKAAERGEIQLHIPAFSLMEPVYSLGGRSKQRKELWQQVSSELQQAARKASDKATIQELSRSFDTVLISRNQRQQDWLLETGRRITEVARIIPLNNAVWLAAAQLMQNSALTLPDSLVGASVLEELKHYTAEQSLFVTRDRKAFNVEAVEEQLQVTNCAVMFSFSDAVERLRLA